MKHEVLVRKAIAAKKHSLSPYSGFRVGAALLSTDGKVSTGCNIENSSFSMTICAERTAIFKAVSEGNRKFSTLAIASDSAGFIPPCGACRQVIFELLPDVEIILANRSGKFIVTTAAALLPMPFTRKFLKS